MRSGQATRRLTHANGADRTGLGRLIELTAGHSGGDALVTVALASTVFFGVPVGEARGPVALYLVITMAAVRAAGAVRRADTRPVQVRAAAMSWRARCSAAGCCASRWPRPWRPGDLPTLFVGALGVLVLSKAYNVSRAAIMPSVLPADITLVSANAQGGAVLAGRGGRDGAGRARA